MEVKKEDMQDNEVLITEERLKELKGKEQELSKQKKEQIIIEPLVNPVQQHVIKQIKEVDIYVCEDCDTEIQQNQEKCQGCGRELIWE